jgi:subtilisin family serine protease
MQRKTFFRGLILALLTLSLAATAAAPVLAKETRKSYIVVLAGDPIATYEGGLTGYARTKAPEGKKVAANSAPAKSYDKFLTSQHNKSLKQAGVGTAAKLHDYTVSLNGYAAVLTPKQVDAIKTQKGVLHVFEDQMRQPQTDSSGKFLGLTAKGGAYAKGVTGENVVVGVIDTGIWPEHPSFADDGSYGPSPIAPVPCEFGNTAHNAVDVAFTCNNKLLGARQMLETYRFFIGAEPDEFDSARDDNGHGTHTASTAAGNAGVQAVMYGSPIAKISGIAPRARIVAYKGLGNLGGFTSDLAAAIDQAVADGVDVINYSIGSGPGLPGPDDLSFLFAADAGVFVAASAGNEGPGPGTIGNPATMPWVTTVGASTQSRFFEGVITLGNGRHYKGASLTPELGWAPLVDAAAAGDELCTPGSLDPKVVTGKIVLCKRGEVGRVEKSFAVFQAGGVGMIQYNADNVDNLFSDSHWVPSVHIDNTPGLAIKSYIARASHPRAKIDTKTSSGKPKRTKWHPAPSMTIFSSRGPNTVAPDILKPDVTAPGLQILAGNSPYPDAGDLPGELFMAIAGTSMSSPHVAGIYALLKQAHPEWSAAEAKSALMTTASQDVRDNDRVHRANPFAMGAGHVAPGGRWGKGSIAKPGLVYDAGFFEYAGFLCGMEWGLVSADDCDFLASVGVPIRPIDLNMPSIGISSVVGSETITRTVTSVTTGTHRVTYKAHVQAPPGYKVKVTPSTLKLRGGESGTFTVTVTNKSGPVDAWRFGSLTWKGEAYSVRSPIAVKAALFHAPAAVSGTGAAGTASFDVKFGYTGSYTAGAHGLIKSTVTQANVKQDPDQDFDPVGDVTAGGANVHSFTLADAAHFRVAMPPEATEPNADLDVYVYGPDGELAAISTAGGTDEHIDIDDPADGTWKVYVHGWQTIGTDSDYTMWSWIVPNATGGSLTINSAPASAVTGATGTVVVGWTGLETGLTADWYLGAVSHTGPSGLMGRTFVNVDNR